MREMSTVVWALRRGVEPDLQRLNVHVNDQRFFVVIASIVVFVPVPLFISGELKDLNEISRNDKVSYELAAIFMCVCAILLIIALLIVLDTFKKVFGKQSLANVKQIRQFVIIFSLVFAFEAIVNILDNKNQFPNVPKLMTVPFLIVWAVQFFIYNFIPIYFLVHTHHKAFNPFRNKTCQPSSSEHTSKTE